MGLVLHYPVLKRAPQGVATISIFEILGTAVMFPYHRSTPFPSLCVSWHSRRRKQLSVTLPSVRLLVSLQISLPVDSRINLSPSLPVTSARLMSADFITTPLGILGVASHGVTTQMTYFTTCLFHLPHGTSVLLFLYLTRLVSLVTICFTSLYLNVEYSFVLASLKSHPSSFYSFPYLFLGTLVLSSHLQSANLGHVGDGRHNIYVEA